MDPSNPTVYLAEDRPGEAGYPNGFDAGTISLDISFASIAEALANYLQAVGIRMTPRPLERAAFFQEYQGKKLKHIIQSASAAFGNAATRLEAFVAATGTYTYGIVFLRIGWKSGKARR